jgi:hypothetical protein
MAALRVMRRPLLLALAIALAPSGLALAQSSYAMRFECRTAELSSPASRQRAEAWVRDRLRAFLPSPELPLTMQRLELVAQQAMLAFYSINRTCTDYLHGKVAEQEADISLSGHEQRIIDFLHDVSINVLPTAYRAQVTDLEAMRQALTELGTTGLQAAKIGEQELAELARKQMIEAVALFNTSFVERTCWDQAFDDQLPFDLSRQNDLLGIGIDVMPCAQRRFRAAVSPLTFESCTIRGVGDWRVRWTIDAPGATGGTGSGEMKQERFDASGDYEVEWGANGAEYRASGDMRLFRRNNGPGAKAGYTLSGDMDIKLTKGDEMVKMMAKLMKKQPGGKSNFSVEPEVSEKPCRSLDG